MEPKLNIPLINRLVEHYARPGTAPLWTYDCCVGGVLQHWGYLDQACQNFSDILGISQMEAYALALGGGFEYSVSHRINEHGVDSDERNRKHVTRLLKALLAGETLGEFGYFHDDREFHG